MKQGNIDLLCDIIWWIRGRNSVGSNDPFNESHVKALEEAIIYFKDQNEDKS